ncbi:hypothetical protein QU42_02080 [Bradyrhizobium sp. UASWS1016]|nr:hypothetical protein QU41_06800 [Bradyrhizobium elkanii]OCX32839.1 hypothetical protein QU42_02080 [Bradyrhizobium sp. UASWS1016]
MVTRQWISSKRDQLKGQARPAKGPYLVVDNDEIASAPTAEPALDEETPISVLLLTPKRAEVTRLAKKYMPAGEPPCLRVGHAVADDAVLLVAARVGELLSLSSSLEWWRFKKFSRVYLLEASAGPDVTNVAALGVCARGELKLPTSLAWPIEQDPVKLVDKLTAGITGRRVHLFADMAAAGWEAVIGDANWAEGQSS